LAKFATEWADYSPGLAHDVRQWHDCHMEKSTDLQEVLRANLRVLLALRRMTNGELAARLGTDRTTVSKRMNGAREWALQDLVDLSDIFGIPVDRLIGETAALLSTVPSRMTGTDAVTGGVTGRYPTSNGARIISFPQAARLRAGYRVKKGGQRRPISVTQAGWRGHHLNAEPVA
jgi:transcriptional regulator with XRE-family HTH domain